MFRVHVSLNFKHEAGELLILRFHQAGIGFTRHRRWRPFHQTVEHMVNAEVTQRGTEEDRSNFSRQEQLFIELVGRTLHQFQLVTQLLGQLFTYRRVQLRAVQPFNDTHFLNGVAFTRLIQIGFIFIEVVNAFEQLAAANRPGNRRTADFQLALNFIQHFHRIADITVEFVHEGQDRRITQTGDFHQLAGTILYAFRGVDNHQTTVDRCQRTIGILGEVFVPRGVQQVHQAVTVWELHYRRGNRDTTLLFHLHPVGFRMLAGTTAFYRTGGLNGLSE